MENTQNEKSWKCLKCEKAKSSVPAYAVGDTLTFGNYGGEPIEWIVMEVRADGSYVLLSKYALDAKPYNTVDEGVTWETCSLREWLNEEFYDTAFTDEEKNKILLSDVVNADNLEYGTEGGNDTQDHVYLLSIDEAEKYFKSKEERICYATEYAENNGADTINGSCWWWLRSSGDYSVSAATVLDDGSIFTYGLNVYFSNSVRPVVLLRLS